MSAVLLDTQVLAWGFIDDARLSARAVQAIEAAEVIWVSPISFYEIGQKVRIGKWSPMGPLVATLPALVEAQNASIAALGAAIALRAAAIEWAHRDPFDRMIAATAMELKAALISSDKIFDTLPSGPEWRGRIW